MVYKPIITQEMVDEVRNMRESIESTHTQLPKDAKCKIIDGKNVWYQEIDNDVIVLRRE